MRRPPALIPTLLLVATALGSSPANAAPFDGNPKLLLHLMSVTTKNSCGTRGSLADCGTAQVSGQSGGAYYFVYALTVKGNMPHVGGAQFGVIYQDNQPDDIEDGAGIDIFSWTNCATLEFATTGVRGWPRPQSSNLIVWNGSGPTCQTGETGVLGYFYLACYGAADALYLIPRPVDGRAKLATCTSIERNIAASDLGSVAFTSTGSSGGCNPCLGNCPPPPLYPDTTPPAAITIGLTSRTATSVRLEWYGSGDDGNEPTLASEYDLRYSTDPITPDNFEQAVRDPLREVTSGIAGQYRYTVHNLAPATTYYLALRVADEVPNWSPISNVLMVATDADPGNDQVPPAAVSDLTIVATTANTATLQWTATGDDGLAGTATAYDVRWSDTPMTSSSYATASGIPNEPAPAPPGTTQTMFSGGLQPHVTRYYGMQVIDDVGNRSPLSNVVMVTTTEIDTIGPAPVSDLTVQELTTTTALITWTSPGDDYQVGTADLYDLRYSSTPITPETVNQASTVVGEPLPAPAGTAQEFLVTSLDPATTYYFSLFTFDNAGNRSLLSNVPSGLTLPGEPDSLLPATITDLAAIASGPSTITLAWTAPGDDGTAGQAVAYDLRLSVTPITPQNFSQATMRSIDAPLPAGNRQQVTVGGLASGTLYYLALRTRDDAGQWSAISNVASRSTLGGNRRPNLMLHVTGVTAKNRCLAGRLDDCRDAVTGGDIAPVGGSGPFYYVYLCVTDALSVGGLQCGISYEGNDPGGRENGSGIDIFEWTLCATIEFPSVLQQPWPAPGSGNVITWDTVNDCQTIPTPVAGYFYMAAYGSDTLRLIPRPVDALAMVADCSADAVIVPPDGLGTARFSPGGLLAGINPCGRSSAVSIERVSWSRIKTLLH